MDFIRRHISFGKLPFLIILYLCLSQLYFVFTKLNGDVSIDADAFSEANIVRGADSLIDLGFWKYYGLNDINYGDKFKNHGTLNDPDWKDKESFVYTHYPPGPDYVIYFAQKLFGIESLDYIRIFPILLAFISFLYFASRLNFVLSGATNTVFWLIVALMPVTSNMMHGLHQQSYNFSLMILALSAALDSFFISKKIVIRNLVILFIAGFFQGWITFDFFFLGTMSSLIFVPFVKSKFEKKTFLLISTVFIVPIIGFCLAHFLHLIQVILYSGGLAAAIKDLFGSYELRSLKASKLFSLILAYFQLMPYENYLGGFALKLIYALFIFCGVITVYPLSFDFNSKKYSLTARFRSAHFIAIFISFLIASAWLIVMRQHATNHTHFVPRHYWLIYLTYIGVYLNAIKIFALEDSEESDIPKINKIVFISTLSIVGFFLSKYFFDQGFITPYTNSLILAAKGISAEQTFFSKLLSLLDYSSDIVPFWLYLQLFLLWGGLGLLTYQFFNSSYYFLFFLIGFLPNIFGNAGLLLPEVFGSIVFFFGMVLLGVFYKKYQSAYFSLVVSLFFLLIGTLVYPELKYTLLILIVVNIYLNFLRFRSINELEKSFKRRDLYCFFLSLLFLLGTFLGIKTSNNNENLRVIKDLSLYEDSSSGSLPVTSNCPPDIFKQNFSYLRLDKLIFNEPYCFKIENVQNNQQNWNQVFNLKSYFLNRLAFGFYLLGLDGKSCYAFHYGVSNNSFDLKINWNDLNQLFYRFFGGEKDSERYWHNKSLLFLPWFWLFLGLLGVLLAKDKRRLFLIFLVPLTQTVSVVFLAHSCDQYQLFFTALICPIIFFLGILQGRIKQRVKDRF